MPKSPDHLLLFDSDGTLADSIPMSYAGCCEVFRQSGLPEPSFDVYCEHFHAPFMQFYIDRGVTASREQVYEWYHIRARHAEAKLFPDVVPTLRILSRIELNVKLGVVSAQKNKTLAMQLEAVASHFDVIVGEKEHKDEELLRLKGAHAIPADRVVYVGDYASDMHAARKAGVRAIGITRGRKTRDILKRAGAHDVVDDLDGLLKLLDW